MVDGRAGAARLRIIDGGDRMNYKPCVDVTFGSAAKVYGDKVLSMVLTGMGADGREGARMLKSAGSTIWLKTKKVASFMVCHKRLRKRASLLKIYHLNALQSACWWKWA